MHRKKAMLYYCFLMRLYHEEDDVMHGVEADLELDSNTTLEDIHDEFYKEYVAGFCKVKTDKEKPMRPTINIRVSTPAGVQEADGAITRHIHRDVRGTLQRPA